MSLRGIFSGAGYVINKFGSIPFIFILLLIEFFLYINGPALFPDWNANYGQLIGVYVLMTIAFLLYATARTRTELKTPISIAVISFVMAFFITWMVMTLLIKSRIITVNENFPSNLILQTVLIQVCVVATSEEIMFRGVLLDVFGANRWSGIVMSSLLFALWHSYAYQIVWYNLDWGSINYVSLLLAFVFGVLLSLIARNRVSEGGVGGLPAVIGIHACYNLMVLGVLSI